MKHLFIINPAAGSRDRTEYYSRQIHDACGKRGLNYEIRVSDAPGGCARLAREAARSGEEYRIYACGGDGTANEAMHGLLGRDNVSLGLIPVGTGNDYVRSLPAKKEWDPADTLCTALHVGMEAAVTMLTVTAAVMKAE